MFEFSMTDVLNELEGMSSVKEKLMKWISFHRKLRDFSLKVFEVQTELEKEYTEQIKRTLEHSITQLIREQNLKDVLQVGKDLYDYTSNNRFGININTIRYGYKFQNT